MFLTSYKCGRGVSLSDAQGPGCRHTWDSIEQGPGFGRSSHTADWCGAIACWFVSHTGCILCSSEEQRRASLQTRHWKPFRSNVVWIQRFCYTHLALKSWNGKQAWKLPRPTANVPDHDSFQKNIYEVEMWNITKKISMFLDLDEMDSQGQFCSQKNHLDKIVLNKCHQV